MNNLILKDIQILETNLKQKGLLFNIDVFEKDKENFKSLIRSLEIDKKYFIANDKIPWGNFYNTYLVWTSRNSVYRCKEWRNEVLNRIFAKYKNKFGVILWWEERKGLSSYCSCHRDIKK